MRRSGRYTLAVMAWIAVYAGWSSVLGLIIAAVTGESLEDGDRVGPTVGLGVSTLFTVVLPLVPTLVALWFNDWLRDGAPSRADRQRAARSQTPTASPPPLAPAPPPLAPAPPARPALAPVEPVRATAARSDVVAPAPLGVPEIADAVPGVVGFPVAPVLRGGDEAPSARLAAAAPAATAGAPAARPAGPATRAGAPAEPTIDPYDPLGVGDLRLPGVGGSDEPLGV
ncbi:MAG TPA: hypothetical protein VNA14_10705 [Mycobacteriales bacterium]|nr:hypothetical protein [Mycobacteriales bacterium]